MLHQHDSTFCQGSPQHSSLLQNNQPLARPQPLWLPCVTPIFHSGRLVKLRSHTFSDTLQEHENTLNPSTPYISSIHGVFLPSVLFIGFFETTPLSYFLPSFPQLLSSWLPLSLSYPSSPVKSQSVKQYVLWCQNYIAVCEHFLQQGF